jgi:NitT/TauT family transport system substrate-binding protein
MPVTLQEPLRALFYAPFYAALTLGAYRREGVAIGFVSAPSPAAAADALFDGSVDAAWGGPMRVIRTYEDRADCDLVCFGEVVTRDPFFLIGCEPRPDFVLGDLFGLRLATVSEVPTPWLCLQEDLRRAGLDPDQLPRIADQAMADNVAALRRGKLDVVQVFEPWAEELLAAGAGHIWYAAAVRGPTSYTSLYTRRSLLAERRTELKTLLRGLYRTQKWLYANPPEALADAAQPFFPAAARSQLRAAVARYHALGIWGRNPILPRAGYERLSAGLISGGFVKSAVSFDRAVDNSLAEEVVRDNPPPLESSP